MESLTESKECLKIGSIRCEKCGIEISPGMRLRLDMSYKEIIHSLYGLSISFCSDSTS
jgi:hypothetical protein